MYVLCGGSVVTLNERQTKVKVDVGILSNFCTSNLQRPKSPKKGSKWHCWITNDIFSSNYI